jgi:hypothetical protein
MANNQRESYDVDAIFRLSHHDALPTLFNRIQSVELSGGHLSGSEKAVLAVMTAMNEIRRRGFATWYSEGGARIVRQAAAWIDTQDLPEMSRVFHQAIEIFTHRETHTRVNLDGSATLAERDEEKLGKLDQAFEALNEDVDSRIYRFVFENRNEFGGH